MHDEARTRVMAGLRCVTCQAHSHIRRSAPTPLQHGPIFPALFAGTLTLPKPCSNTPAAQTRFASTFTHPIQCSDRPRSTRPFFSALFARPPTLCWHTHTSDALLWQPCSRISGAMCVSVPWNTLLTCVSKWSILKDKPKSAIYMGAVQNSQGTAMPAIPKRTKQSYKQMQTTVRQRGERVPMKCVYICTYMFLLGLLSVGRVF